MAMEAPFVFIFCGSVWCLAVVDTILDTTVGDVAAAGDVGVPQLRITPPRLRLLLLPGLRTLAVAVVVAVAVADIVGVPDGVAGDDVTVGDSTNVTTASSCSSSLSFLFSATATATSIHYHWLLLLSCSRSIRCCRWLLLLSISMCHLVVLWYNSGDRSDGIVFFLFSFLCCFSLLLVCWYLLSWCLACGGAVEWIFRFFFDDVNGDAMELFFRIFDLYSYFYDEWCSSNPFVSSRMPNCPPIQ